MKHTKFVVKVTHTGAPRIEYVQRIDRKPIQTTVEPNLALLMGRVIAMEVLESFKRSKWTSEMVAVQVD